MKIHCSTILCDIEKDGVLSNNKEYFLLSDVDPMDKEIRENLQKEKLVSIK